MDNQYRKAFVNTVSGCLRLFINIFILLILTPYIINKVGVDGFGLWSIVLSVLSLFDLLDLGFGTTIIKYVVEHKAKNEHEYCNQILSTLLLVYSALVCIGFFSLGILALFFNTLFSIPVQNHETALYLIAILGLRSLFIILPFSLFKGILFAEQYIYLNNAITLVGSIIYASLAWFGLSSGKGLLFLASASLFAAVVEHAAYVCFAFYLDKHLKFAWSLVSLSALKKVLPFSFAQFVANIGSLVLLNTDLIIIKLFLPLSDVALYAIPLRIIAYCYMLLGQFSHILTPVIVNTHVLDQKEEMRLLFLRGTKYVLVPATIIATAGIICSQEILGIWINKDFEAASSAFVILLASMWMTTLYSIGGDILQMTGYHFIALKYTWIAIMVNIISSVLLVGPFHLNGVALGTFCAFFVGLFLDLRKVRSIYQISLFEYAKAIIPISVLPACAQGALLIYLKSLFPITTLWQLGLINLLPIAVYLFFAWLLLSSPEKKSLHQVIFMRKEG